MNSQVFGIDFTALRTEQIAALVTTETAPNFRMLVTTNLDHVVQLQHNDIFRAAYDHAWMATVDGMPVYLYARLMGSAVKARAPGSDLTPAILDRLVPGEHRPYFVASTPAVLSSLKNRLVARGFATESIGGEVPPLGFQTDPGLSNSLADQIRDHQATHLFMGVGAPKSEVWLYQNRQRLGCCYAFSFGTGLDYAAGTKRRASRLVQIIGMEWAWRVAQEPRRLAARYFLHSFGFLRAVASDLRQRRAD